MAWLLRPGRAGSNTAADHVVVFEQALAQLPAGWAGRDEHGRRPVLVRTDGAGATHRFAQHLHEAGVQYSLGFTLGMDYHDPLLAVPAAAWTPAYNAGGEARDGAWVAELTGLVDLSNPPVRPDRNNTTRGIPRSRRAPPDGREHPQAPQVPGGTKNDDRDRRPSGWGRRRAAPGEDPPWPVDRPSTGHDDGEDQVAHQQTHDGEHPPPPAAARGQSEAGSRVSCMTEPNRLRRRPLGGTRLCKVVVGHDE